MGEALVYGLWALAGFGALVTILWFMAWLVLVRHFKRKHDNNGEYQ